MQNMYEELLDNQYLVKPHLAFNKASTQRDRLSIHWREISFNLWLLFQL